MTQQFPLFAFFDQVFVINLPERTDRRAELCEQLERLGSSEKVIFFAAIKPSDKGEFPSIGARGCFMSHLAILKEAKSKNLNNVLILEDDLSFTAFLIEQQGKVVEELKQLSWDIAYLGHGIDLPNTKTIFQLCSEPLRMTHFIAFNKLAISRMVDFLELVMSRPAGHPEGGPMHVDGAYSTFRRQNSDTITLIANPILGFQRASVSDIAGSKWFDKVPVLATLATLARKIINWKKYSF
jgi:hypothetical protein